MGSMSNTIDTIRSQLHVLTETQAPQATVDAGVKAVLSDLLRHANTTVDYGRVAANMATASDTARTALVQSRLDAFRDRFSGPYLVAGQSVKASCQFRMVGGYNDSKAGVSRQGDHTLIDTKNPQLRELFTICARAHAPFPQHCLMGCPTASEIVKVTQALIDAGKLPAGPGDVASRIKTMQWQWGIGVDCTDYVMSAAMVANGKSFADVRIDVGHAALPQPGTDYFDTADHNPHLAKPPITEARPGDVFRLDSPHDVGHRAVVHSHTVMDAASCALLAKTYGPSATVFMAGGPIHTFQMDASWSAGEFGASWGGVRRDTWFYNEGTKEWAQVNVRVSPPAQPAFDTTPKGPANDVFHGVYRFR